jgi:hypothetical protein
MDTFSFAAMQPRSAEGYSLHLQGIASRCSAWCCVLLLAVQDADQQPTAHIVDGL